MKFGLFVLLFLTFSTARSVISGDRSFRNQSQLSVPAFSFSVFPPYSGFDIRRFFLAQGRFLVMVSLAVCFFLPRVFQQVRVRGGCGAGGGCGFLR